MLGRVLAADTAAGSLKLYHATGFALMGLAPAAILSQPGSMPRVAADYGLLLAVPPHAHIACNFIIADYVPRVAQGAARLGMLGVSAVTALGILQMNVNGGGVTSAVQRLWKR